jgi:Ala-tRNA(Pro) deacylase
MMCIQGYLQQHRVRFEAMLHRPESTASRRAHSVHVPGDQVAKGVLIRADDRFVLTVLPSTHRVDLERLALVLEANRVRLATEDEVSQVFVDCERGAVPPFGRLYGVMTVVDTSLAAWAEIVVEANLRHEDLRLRYRDYEAVEEPLRARFARPIVAKRPRTTGRQAG